MRENPLLVDALYGPRSMHRCGWKLAGKAKFHFDHLSPHMLYDLSWDPIWVAEVGYWRLTFWGMARPAAQVMLPQIVGWFENNYEKIYGKSRGICLTLMQYQNFPGAEENHDKPQSKLKNCVQTEIRIEHLPYKSLVCYRYINSFGYPVIKILFCFMV